MLCKGCTAGHPHIPDVIWSRLETSPINGYQIQAYHAYHTLLDLSCYPRIITKFSQVRL